MYGLIMKCCGTQKSVDIFEQSLMACTKPTWEIPPAQPLQILLEIVSYSDPESETQIEYNRLLAHLETDQENKKVETILKYLVILDMVVEERVFLNRMGKYNNSQLLFAEGQKSGNRRLGDLVGSYYVYIKQKAKYYCLEQKQLSHPQYRHKLIQQGNSIAILNHVNICFKIQNLILEVNSKYRGGDKSLPLVQHIFSLLLKSYLYCHSVVTISIQVFVSRLLHLSRYDLEYLTKFVKYVGKDYKTNFSAFVHQNIEISSFKTVLLDQLMWDDQNILALIEAQLKNIEQDPGICPDPEPVTGLSDDHIVVSHDSNSTETMGRLEKLIETSILKQEESSKEANCRKQEIKTAQSLNIEYTHIHEIGKQTKPVFQTKVVNSSSAPKPNNTAEVNSSQVFMDYMNTYSDSMQEEQSTTVPVMNPFEIYAYYGITKEPDQDDGDDDDDDDKEEENEENEEELENEQNQDGHEGNAKSQQLQHHDDEWPIVVELN